MLWGPPYSEGPVPMAPMAQWTTQHWVELKKKIPILNMFISRLTLNLGLQTCHISTTKLSPTGQCVLPFHSISCRRAIVIPTLKIVVLGWDDILKSADPLIIVSEKDKHEAEEHNAAIDNFHLYNSLIELKIQPLSWWFWFSPIFIEFESFFRSSWSFFISKNSFNHSQ